MNREPWAPYSKNPEKFDEEVKEENLPDTFLELRERFVDEVGAGSILDAGCGSGRDTDFFAGRGFSAHGIDMADGMIEYARQHRDGSYQKMDLRDLSFQDDLFDGVWASASIFFMPPADMEVTLQEFHRVLKTSGVLYVNFKEGEGEQVKQIWGDSVTEYHVAADTAEDLLKAAGFTLIDKTTNVSKSRDNTFFNFLCRK